MITERHCLPLPFRFTAPSSPPAACLLLLPCLFSRILYVGTLPRVFIIVLGAVPVRVHAVGHRPHLPVRVHAVGHRYPEKSSCSATGTRSKLSLLLALAGGSAPRLSPCFCCRFCFPPPLFANSDRLHKLVRVLKLTRGTTCIG